LYGGAGDDWVIASGGDDRVQGGLEDDEIDSATYSEADCARQSGGTGRFDWEERGHWGQSNAKTVHAYSMRLSRPKGLGRRMDSAGSSFDLQSNIQTFGGIA
jgi:hypothetical protein